MTIPQGPLAQLVEQLTLNQLVVGSSPTRPTTFRSGCIPRFANFMGKGEGTGSRPAFDLFVFVFEKRKTFSTGISLRIAKVAELVDALDLGSSGVTRESSSLSFRTIPSISG